YSCACLFEGSFVPLMSLLYISISVTRPLFGFMYLIGAPVLALALLWSASNALHSGPTSVTFSSITSPQLLHTYSPFSLSNMISLLPQLGHFFMSPPCSSALGTSVLLGANSTSAFDSSSIS